MLQQERLSSSEMFAMSTAESVFQLVIVISDKYKKEYIKGEETIKSFFFLLKESETIINKKDRCLL